MLFEYCNSKSNIPDNILDYRLVLVNHLEMVDMYGGAKNSASAPIPRNWCAWCTRAFGIAQNRIAALACFVNHARWRLNLGKKKRGEGKKWTHSWESKRERKREREWKGEGIKDMNASRCSLCCSYRKLIESYAQDCTYVHRALFVYRISSLSFSLLPVK